MNIIEKFNINVKEWFNENGDSYRRINYPELNSDSVVFDVGGYLGTFTESIYTRYSPNVYLFEPVKIFYDVCDFKFSHLPKIRTFNYGLSSNNRKCKIYGTGDASSTSIIGEEIYDLIYLKDILQVIDDFGIQSIDLLKINIEGEEYNLMERLISNSDVLSRVKNIQIQYHTFIDSAEEKRDRINSILKKSHECDWCYEWVWENWKIK